MNKFKNFQLNLEQQQNIIGQGTPPAHANGQKKDKNGVVPDLPDFPGLPQNPETDFD